MVLDGNTPGYAHLYINLETKLRHFNEQVLPNKSPSLVYIWYQELFLLRLKTVLVLCWLWCFQYSGLIRPDAYHKLPGLDDKNGEELN